VYKLHAQPVELAAIQFTAGPNQVVQANDFNPADMFEQRVSQRLAHETANARNQDLHAAGAKPNRFCREDDILCQK
jgi:hypothetical protein